MPKFFDKVNQRSRQVLNAALDVGLTASGALVLGQHRSEVQINHPIQPPVKVSSLDVEMAHVVWVHNDKKPLSEPHRFAPRGATL